MKSFRALACLLAGLYLSTCHLWSEATVTTLYSFNTTNGGAIPFAGLAKGPEGYWYGAASREFGVYNQYDSSGFGTLFKVTSNGAFTKLFSFSGTNGYRPSATLLRAADGNFYGTTQYGGATFQSIAMPWGQGVVFRMTPAGAVTVLHHFRTNALGATEGFPLGKLVQHTSGDLYGTTSGETAVGLPLHGSVFKITTSGLLTTLATFANTNGSKPWTGLVAGKDGNFYGTTTAGGSNGAGTVFRISPSGDLVTLVSFAGTNGSRPNALLQGADEQLYGTTRDGGVFNQGTIFRLTGDGVLATLFSFDTTNGFWPTGCLMQGPDGVLYGATHFGGASVGGSGVFFSITTNGLFSRQHLFSDPHSSVSELNPGDDGWYYGTASIRGANGVGSIFRLLIVPDPPVFTSFMTEGQTLSFGWNAAVGRSYQVWCKTNLAQSDWVQLGDPILATNSPAFLSDSATGHLQKFYRLELLP